MASRKTEIKRMMRNLDRPPLELSFLLQDVEDPVNVGSAFRIADALKVSEVVLTGITAQPPHKLITKVGRGKDQRVPWRYEADVEAAIRGLKAKGWQIVAVELSSNAACYLDVEYADRTCLLVGHEDHGVTKKALALADQGIFLPMYGKGASLNVHMALGITAFHVVHHRLLGRGQEG